MGFDLYGLSPSGEEKPDFPVSGREEEIKAYFAWQDNTKGSYYRQNVWGWKPVWEYVSAFCGYILSIKDLQRGYFNDGLKISKTKANRIAGRINKLNKNGSLEEYVKARNKIIERMPDEECDICKGTGGRKKPPEIGPGDVKCNGCSGEGTRRPFAVNYMGYKDDIIEFGEFCKHSGGFTIL